MLRRPVPGRRRATTIVEAAFVLPLTFLLILGLFVGGLGIFRYQEVAHIARLTARYASAHGGSYAQEHAVAIAAGTLPTVNEAYLTTNVAGANAIGLGSSPNVSVTITTHSGTYDWDDLTDTNNRSTTSTYTNSSGQSVTVTNTVSVTVTYKWFPEVYLVGPITLSSTSVMPMSY